MSILLKFGLRIKELRAHAGLSQEGLASRANLDRSYIGGIERGERNVSLLNIEKLANALDVDLSYFMDEEQFKPQTAYMKQEYMKPLESRFIYDFDRHQHVIAWRVQGVLSEHEVKRISQNMKNTVSFLPKEKLKLIIDNRTMMVNGQPFVFTPEVNELLEELQIWFRPYIKNIVVLCNSKLMKIQMDRIAKRSGVWEVSKHLYYDENEKYITETYLYLDITSNRILDTAI